jgi:hypothetical protein
VVSVKPNDPASPIPNMPSIHYDFRLAALAGDAVTGRVGADPSQIVKKTADAAR